MRFRLIPTDDRFFELFNDSATNVAECARRLRDVLNEPPSAQPTPAIEHVIDCERRGDAIVRDILQRLNTTFVTPFDREDIHALAEELDDVVDDMLTVTHLLQVTRPTSPLPELKEQADVLVQMADESVALLARLESMRGIEPHLEAIDRLESEGDTIKRRILARLFSGEFEALEVLRWKDTVEALEAALNTLEDVSNVVESIVLKHA
jgi:predicted phosphate transport protein (TIGR00153 family)